MRGHPHKPWAELGPEAPLTLRAASAQENASGAPAMDRPAAAALANQGVVPQAAFSEKSSIRQKLIFGKNALAGPPPEPWAEPGPEAPLALRAASAQENASGATAMAGPAAIALTNQGVVPQALFFPKSNFSRLGHFPEKPLAGPPP